VKIFNYFFQDWKSTIKTRLITLTINQQENLLAIMIDLQTNIQIAPK